MRARPPRLSSEVGACENSISKPSSTRLLRLPDDWLFLGRSALLVFYIICMDYIFYSVVYYKII